MKRKVIIKEENGCEEVFGHKVKWTPYGKVVLTPEESAHLAVEELVEDSGLDPDDIKEVDVIDIYDDGRREETKII